MRPPRRINSAEENALTGMMGAVPSRPPNSTISPTSRPGTGIIRTAVVLLFITPIAISSAMIAAMVSAEVEPGTATMSMPTEQTLVQASSLSSDNAPTSAASIMPASSETGMKAPLMPPTELLAIAPPFLTASVNKANAAVVPCVPARSNPIASRILATESPGTGVGASDRSMMPNGIPRRRAASRPQTAGAVMEARQYSHEVGTGNVVPYGASITDADIIMSDGKSVEHVGVTPDELLLPSAQDLATHRDIVLARAVELAGSKIDPA